MTVADVKPDDLLPPAIAAAGRLIDQEYLKAAATWPDNRLTGYTTALDYYDGDQDAKVTERLKEFLELNAVPYQENFCETIVDALAERLHVAGVESPNEQLAAWLKDRVWDANELDAEQVRIHGEATKLGDAFVIVDWDPDRQIPRVVFNPPDVVRIEYDGLGKPRYGVKVWNSDAKGTTNPAGRAIKRMNLYYPDRVEKWFRLSADSAGGWYPHLDEGDSEIWPIPWQTAAGKPRGIPVFHFANKPRRDHYGRAEHAATIPQQNRLNKELIDLSLILDTMGAPQRWATGTKTGSGLKSAPGELWESESENAKFGQFEAADPAGPLASINKTIERMGGRSRTPMHMLLAEQEAPSGESRKTAESGLVAKAHHRAVFHGQTWVNVIRMAVIVAADQELEDGVDGEKPLKPPIDAAGARFVAINVKWTDPETRNEKEHLETLALMHELGVSTDTILTLIPGIDAQDELKKRAKEDADGAERMMNALAAGGTANPPEDGQRDRQPPPPSTRTRPPAKPPATP